MKLSEMTESQRRLQLRSLVVEYFGYPEEGDLVKDFSMRKSVDGKGFELVDNEDNKGYVFFQPLAKHTPFISEMIDSTDTYGISGRQSQREILDHKNEIACFSWVHGGKV